MEVVISKNKLNKNVIYLEELFNQYRENSISMYKEVMKIDSYWYGEDKDKFISDINNIERNNFLLISDSLDSILGIYNSINDSYNSDIYYNNINKKAICDSISDSIKNLKSISRDFNNLSLPYDYSSERDISMVRNNNTKIINDLEEYYNTLVSYSNRIEDIEMDVLNRVNNI